VSESSVRLRDATEADLDELARLWFDGWQDAHAAVLPGELAGLRTLASFRERLQAGLDSVRVAELADSVAGFAMLKGNELYQFYVAAEARGTSVAPLLMRDTLSKLSRAGITTAWLACAIGNERAARFYEKSGWRRAGVVTSELPTPDGMFPLDVWRYEISIEPDD
jgi:GNAT superfamily N-acetyltransferase